ncbi:MAG TPA: HNH endonuclease [Anaerohalosphaeraceae bacterium]|nr:HNH endonuclease [Anaerohalosphaeraceae bacterium]HOL88473.1 HNH endonuclease [Anaerohalosphaeraceae bacterium]HOQ04523.1 HNH endonuclease [Anaerohalosphaeraceae bacterium]HPP56950.1 HNH endonuclease [Anaerohalosphaeraceae bacterium]
MISATSQSAMDCRVLVLNKHYMALRVISARRAFSLLCRNLAEVISCDDGTYANYDFQTWQQISRMKDQFKAHPQDWVSTVNFDLAVPRIIRLLFYDRLPRQTVKFNRRNLFARDGNRCQYCGKKFPTSELSLDHVIPRRLGGQSTWENVVCACLQCNIKKGGRTPQQANMKLIQKPVKPKRNPVIHIHLSHERYHSWKQFLDHAYWSVELT